MDYVKMTQAMGAINPKFVLPLKDRPEYFLINEAVLSNQALDEVKKYLLQLLVPREYRFTIRDQGYIDIEEMREFLDPVNLAELRLVRMDRVLMPDQENWRQNLDRDSLRRGFDEAGEFLLLFEMDGVFLQGAVTLHRFGSAWAIHTLGSYWSRGDAYTQSGLLRPSAWNNISNLSRRIEIDY